MTDPVSCRADTRSQEPPNETGPHFDRLTSQVLIDALIEIDLAFEREREELSRSHLDIVSWYRMQRTLREQHRQRREPYVQQFIAHQDKLEAENRAVSTILGLASDARLGEAQVEPFLTAVAPEAAPSLPFVQTRYTAARPGAAAITAEEF